MPIDFSCDLELNWTNRWQRWVTSLGPDICMYKRRRWGCGMVDYYTCSYKCHGPFPRIIHRGHTGTVLSLTWTFLCSLDCTHSRVPYYPYVTSILWAELLKWMWIYVRKVWSKRFALWKKWLPLFYNKYPSYRLWASSPLFFFGF